MIRTEFNNNVWKNILAYAAAVALCLAILIWVMELWNANLHIPFSYSGDALFSGMSIKGMIDNGWFLRNDFVGMPTGFDAYDFPSADVFHLLMLKFISLFSSDYAVVINSFFLLTFPLTTLSSLFAFRQFKLSYASSIVASLLFTFLPFHFLRGEYHILVAAYYMIPLIVMVILWVYSEEPFLFKNNPDNGRLKFEFNFKSTASIVICLLVASTGLYYAFFACFFLLIAGVPIYLLKRKRYNLLIIETLIALIIIGTFANILPNIAYVYNHGTNSEAVQRSPVESEMFGLKIDQLLMPVDGHRLPALANLKNKYNRIAPLVNENRSSTLGFIGSIGFLILIGKLFYKSHQNCTEILNDNLSKLNLSAVLLATIGGLGFFVALVIPGIRSYNRISVYIAFFSLFAVSLLLDRYYRKFVKTKISRYFYYGFLLLILTIGILDQTNKSFVPPYDLLAAEYASDGKFISEIEASVPANAMIFQLPYVSFPENLSELNMGDYELFRGYLHSNNLRWSYGAMKGREGDFWQRKVSQMPLNEFVENLSLAGFNGIYIDRRGYEDKGTEIEAGIKSLLKIEPIISEDNNLVFFNMNEYNKKMKE